MEHKLHLHNTLTRQKERFEPLNPPFVGMYLCGPTVYGDPHLGHARSAISFDILFRWLKYSGYKVRYVRNITDVGHLTGDSDEGEDKISKQARLEQLEPMEVAQYYTDRYHHLMARLNVSRPSIEPRATGHIPEQIALVQQILDNGFAYVSRGSVYFDVQAYRKAYPYGELSGRDQVEESIQGTRDLDGQDEKRHPSDFALWKNASPEHLMKWESPWGVGFPGWHIECTAMSTKYLGAQFDIHAGGLDLMFPHHEAEIAQSNACQHHHHPTQPGNEARYWLHNNMVTIGGQKMGKSLGNFITLEEFFTGTHRLLTQAFSPMAIRFFVLQSHYRSTLDFSDEALRASEKAYRRLMAALRLLDRIQPTAGATTGFDIPALGARLTAALNDDLNTAIAIAELFEAAKWLHALHQGQEQISEADLAALRTLLKGFVTDVLGLSDDEDSDQTTALDAALQLLVELRADARKTKNFAISDQIRDRLAAAGVQLKDGPAGTTWVVE